MSSGTSKYGITTYPQLLTMLFSNLSDSERFFFPNLSPKALTICLQISPMYKMVLCGWFSIITLKALKNNTYSPS